MSRRSTGRLPNYIGFLDKPKKKEDKPRIHAEYEALQFVAIRAGYSNYQDMLRTATHRIAVKGMERATSIDGHAILDEVINEIIEKMRVAFVESAAISESVEVSLK